MYSHCEPDSREYILSNLTSDKESTLLIQLEKWNSGVSHCGVNERANEISFRTSWQSDRSTVRKN